ncbi:cytochrome b [Pontivivens insulae]|uniref:Cytochrome b561 n=1 Tax=Pontivivens insulae TaxID=1639689 RepID=A0A2R8AF35_9RHOB|nr:cytochrome b [Pontivivens insulae]RED12107.1 cytochrome b561 [Pontivivens insulae]SPF30863.1 Cytochrome b561 [Pontivivens insulae]
MTTNTYSRTRRFLHWSIAILVIAMIPAGSIFTDFDNRAAIEATFGEGSFGFFYDMHKSVGFLVLFLMVARIAMIFIHPKPDYDPELTKPEKAGSGAVHGLLYLVLIAMPILGWAGVSAFDAPLPVFGLFDMPAILEKDRELSRTLLDWHEIVGKVIIGLVVVHIAAALFHQFVKKDGLIRRMLG